MTNKAISALMAKVKEIFTTVASEVDTEGSTFLAFTIPGIPMSPRDLDFSLSSNEAGLTPSKPSMQSLILLTKSTAFLSSALVGIQMAGCCGASTRLF
uniref:Uncharacterized protein n=1 Tax=Desertifilum tharense IPPAS B-1220 TaxID=1781255 RepID=A0ACD5GQ86_9CYAN